MAGPSSEAPRSKLWDIREEAGDPSSPSESASDKKGVY